MGQQYNKQLKRKRREKYLKRKTLATKQKKESKTAAPAAA
jgi:hypothetical protein